MAKARQCDRCKKLYLSDPTKTHYKLQRLDGQSTRYTRYTHAIDLCPDCDKSLGNWLKALEGETKIE